MSGNKNRAKIIAVIGGSGSGKTAWIRQQLARGRPKRLLIWDPKPTSDYSDLGEVFTDRTKLLAAIAQAGAAGGLRAIYRPGPKLDEYGKRFDWLCRAAFAWKNCTLVGEELSDVTKAGWSPQGWRLCVTQGRSEGLTIFGATQRPALVDKTFLSNATLIHCGRLNARSDRMTMADVLDCDPKDLVDLRPLEWIERADTGETRRGKLTF